MPIAPIVLQRRHAELGRIRLGDKGSKGQPQKLDKYRFTSPHETHIRDLAELYGGKAESWDNNGKPEWEVKTTADSIPVVVVKGGLSQWMETWSGGGCVHRCDGITNQVTGQPCEQDTTTITFKGQTYRAHDVAKPTTRLSVMLPELEAIGVWRMESHGWNSAAEIPNMHDLAAYLGDLVPARLLLAERRSVKDGQTRRFVVPVLDLQVSAARLTAIAQAASGNGLAAISGPAAPALGGSIGQPDWETQIAACTSKDAVTALWHEIGKAGELDAWKDALLARASEVTVVEATIDDEPDEDRAWAALVAQAGAQGMTMPELEALLAERYPEGAGGPDFVELTRFLKTGEVAA